MPPRKPSTNPLTLTREPDEPTPTPSAEEISDPVARIMEQITGGQGAFVEVLYIDDTGKAVLTTRISAERFDAFTIGEQYGGGDYIFRVKDRNNRYAGQSQVRLHGPPRDEAPAFNRAARLAGTQDQAATVPTHKGGTDPMLALMMQMLQQTREDARTAQQQTNNLILAMITNKEGLSIKDLIPLLKQGNSPGATIADMLAGLRELQAMTPPGESRGDDTGGGFVGNLIGELLPKLLAASSAPATPVQGATAPPQAAIPSPKPAASPVASPTTPPAATGAAGDAQSPIGQLAALLGMGAQCGGEPEVYAEVVADAFADDGKSLATMPSDELVQLLTVAAPEPHRSTLTNHADWLRRVADAFKALHEEDPNDNAADASPENHNQDG